MASNTAPRVHANSATPKVTMNVGGGGASSKSGTVRANHGRMRRAGSARRDDGSQDNVDDEGDRTRQQELATDAQEPALGRVAPCHSPGNMRRRLFFAKRQHDPIRWQNENACGPRRPFLRDGVFVAWRETNPSDVSEFRLVTATP
jgi:hypothetical protein